jgi:hypothetical protein
MALPGTTFSESNPTSWTNIEPTMEISISDEHPNKRVQLNGEI